MDNYSIHLVVSTRPLEINKTKQDYYRDNITYYRYERYKPFLHKDVYDFHISSETGDT